MNNVNSSKIYNYTPIEQLQEEIKTMQEFQDKSAKIEMIIDTIIFSIAGAIITLLGVMAITMGIN